MARFNSVGDASWWLLEIFNHHGIYLPQRYRGCIKVIVSDKAVNSRIILLLVLGIEWVCLNDFCFLPKNGFHILLSQQI